MRPHDNHIQEAVAACLIWMSAILIMTPFAWMIGDLLWKGLPYLSLHFLWAAPQDAGREGGIGPILISTAMILGICMTVTLPVGVGTALYLAEYTRQTHFTGRFIRSSLDILAGVPSIVFGLFGNALFCQVLGLGFSILSGGLTLACMVLPIVIRTAEESFRSIAQEQRLAAAALGFSCSTTVRAILVPAALPGLLAGVVLGLGRAIAETAALIFTSGYVDRMPASFMDSGRTLSVHIYDLAMNVAGGTPHAYATALVLVGMVLGIILLFARITHRWTTSTRF